jgi:hypothetical protein
VRNFTELVRAFPLQVNTTYGFAVPESVGEIFSPSINVTVVSQPLPCAFKPWSPAASNTTFNFQHIKKSSQLYFTALSTEQFPKKTLTHLEN